jgi:NAD(P)-dependent dehydrogenase (short-subunit alcohol dehydrogenase family)
MGSQRVALVTGASAGFGRKAALELARRGWQVFGGFRGTSGGYEARSAEVKAEAATGGLSVETVRLDVTNDESVTSAVRYVLDSAGRIDGLVNAHGIGIHGPWPSISVPQFKDELEVLLVGCYRTCLAVEPAMRGQGSGWIVNVSSDAAIRAAFWEVAYSAAKYGLEGMSLGMRLESQHAGIRVCVLEPGWCTDTDYEKAMISTVDWENPSGPYADLVRTMTENQPKVERGRVGAQDIANAIADLMEMDDPPFRTRVHTAVQRRDDIADAEYERSIFEFYMLDEFRAPWAQGSARGVGSQD